MIRKRKSQMGEEKEQEEDIDKMEGNFPFSKRESGQKTMDEISLSSKPEDLGSKVGVPSIPMGGRPSFIPGEMQNTGERLSQSNITQLQEMQRQSMQASMNNSFRSGRVSQPIIGTPSYIQNIPIEKRISNKKSTHRDSKRGVDVQQQLVNVMKEAPILQKRKSQQIHPVNQGIHSSVMLPQIDGSVVDLERCPSKKEGEGEIISKGDKASDEEKEIDVPKIIKNMEALDKKIGDETKLIYDSFSSFKCSQIFRNPFDKTMSKEEKIVRIFYISGFTFFPYLGWLIAAVFGTFCKERKTNNNIIMFRILSAFQCLIVGIIIGIFVIIIKNTGVDVLGEKCRSMGVRYESHTLENNRFNIVFFGPVQTKQWMESALARIGKDMNFNIYAFSFPDPAHDNIKGYRRTYLKNALDCAKLKSSSIILFSYQIEAATNFTIPFLETNKVIGLYSFSQKFKKEKPFKETLGENKVIYAAPKENALYDIYSSVSLMMFESEQQKYLNTNYIIHNSFGKYQIRCASTLADDYMIVMNNFAYTVVGESEKKTTHENSDFDLIIDDFYQYLAFVRDVTSSANLELYRRLLYKNVMCESRAAACLF